MPRYVNPVPDYSYAPGGTLEFYISNTTTPKDTFSDVNESIPNTNPVVIEADGKVPNIFYSGSARVVCKDAQGVQQWERDPVQSGGEAGGSLSEWSSLNTYARNDVVTFGDDYYRSLINGNLNNQPSSTLAAWSLVQFVEAWNPNETYAVAEVVNRSGLLYSSLITSNLGNDPATDAASWRALSADAVGQITSATTVSGYGIAGVSQESGASFVVTFSNAVTATDNQVIVVSYDGNAITNDSIYVAGPENLSPTTARIAGLLVATTGTASVLSFPLNIVRYRL